MALTPKIGRPGKHQPRFTAGELDPLLADNTDEGSYLKGAALMQNVRVLPQGGFANGWGTQQLGVVPGAGNVKILPFAHSRAEAYDLVFYDSHIDVYSSAGFAVTLNSPFTSAMIPTIDMAQQIDTGIVAHPQVAPWRILYNRAPTAWSVGAAPLQNIPIYDYADTVYTNSVAAIWVLEFFNIAVGNHYELSINGVAAASATWTGAPATDVNNIIFAILSIPEIGPGITCTWGGPSGGNVTPGGYTVGANQYAVEFSGAQNIGDGWAVSGKVADNPNAAVLASHARIGVLPGEPIISASRGWPRCVALFGQRALLGGMPGVPNAILASQATNYFNFDTRIQGATAPMLIPLDVIGAAAILRLQAGQTLNVFCEDQELWLNGAGLDATQTPNFPKATRNGIAPTTAPFNNEGKTIYVDNFGGALYRYAYNLQVQNYESDNLTERTAALVSTIVDASWRPRAGATNTNEAHLVRGDGLGVTAHLLFSEDIAAFARRATDGQFLAVSCNARREVTYVVSRLAGGAPQQTVERETPGLLLDQSINFNFLTPQKVVTGLAALNGATVWAIADGNPQGPFVVAGGQITLGFAALSGYVGRWTAPRVVTMPQPRDIAPRTVQRRPCRAHTVRLRVKDTTSVAIGANHLAFGATVNGLPTFIQAGGSPPVDVGFGAFGGPTDAPSLNNPFTGEVVVAGLQGYSDDGLVEITQLRPGLLTVVGMTVEVDL
jgi:hypothetical protein